MGSDIKLSIIVPCYKVEKYLGRCLDSLLAQTLDDMELICINDGSPDDSLRILTEYRDENPGRIIIIDKPNEGVWKARRDGIAAASGEYIGFLDPDDYADPDFAKDLYDTAKKNDADIACCGFLRTDMRTGRVYSREMTGFRYDCIDMNRDPGLMLEVNAALWNKIFRAEIIKAMPDLSHIPAALDDMVFAQLIYLNAGTVAFSRSTPIHYMVRGDSVVSTIDETQIPGIYEAMRELKGIYEKQAPGLGPYLDAIAFLHLGISLMHRLESSRCPDLSKALRDNTVFLDGFFPGWRRNPFIRPGYVMSHRGANLKLLIVRCFYSLHIMGPFLRAYGYMIRHFGIDIKW